jgi:hypothetical protein
MTTQPERTSSPSHCPLCGQPNRCAMEIERETGVAQDPCWCTAEQFSPALLERMPPEGLGRACICQACVRSEGQA